MGASAASIGADDGTNASANCRFSYMCALLTSKVFESVPKTC